MFDTNQQLIAVGLLVAGLGIMFWGLGALLRGLTCLVSPGHESHGLFKHK